MKIRDWIDFVCSLSVICVIFSPVIVVAMVSHAPVGTTLIVIFLTTFAFESVETATLAYIGVGLFGVSFPIGEYYGLAPAIFVWSAGICIWVAGVHYGYRGGLRVPRHKLLA